MSVIKLATSYFGYSRRTWVPVGLFILTFTIVFSLYNLPLEAVLYASLLCCFGAGIYMLVDFFQYTRRHRRLTELKESIIWEMNGLPLPNDQLEQDYAKLLTILFEAKEKVAVEAENAKRELTEYYTLWAHQVKTPISAMRLLLQSEDNKENAELSLELLKIEQYVNMVLQYLRVESTSSDFVVKHHSLAEIVKPVVRKYAKMFVQKKIKLDLSELDCKVLTDEKWLGFVIEQILSNALKYTPQGTISIFLADAKAKTLVIQDTGIGIAAEDLPRVFEQGFTGYNGRLEKRSTGIGLYLSKRVLAKLSHTIHIQSEVGQGTQVRLGLDNVDTVFE